MKIDACKLEAPAVAYADNNRPSLRYSGSWNLDAEKGGKIKRFQQSGICLGWGTLSFRTEKIPQNVRNTFAQVCTSHGLRLEKSTSTLDTALPDIIFDQQRKKRRTEIEQENLVANRLGKFKAESCTLVLVHLPANKKEADKIYNMVKRCGDKYLGLHTLCVYDKKFLQTGNLSYLGNVVLKANAKLGGHNHILADDVFKDIRTKQIMIVGIDVTHPGAQTKHEAPSVAAVVASTDDTLSQWPADIRLQRKSRSEMVFEVGDMMKSRLRLWKSQSINRGLYPPNILIYRDGVSEGQEKEVLTYELQRIKAACAELYTGDMPKITLIIVKKRHHTRFFGYDTAGAKHLDNHKNFTSGLVVDRTITDLRRFDFFLQSHNSLLGIAKPMYYVVLLNEIFREKPKPSNQMAFAVPLNQAGKENFADDIQNLTYNLCFMYSRATTAVSTCPPIYLADLACYRARKLLPDAIWAPQGGEGYQSILRREYSDLFPPKEAVLVIGEDDDAPASNAPENPKTNVGPSGAHSMSSPKILGQLDKTQAIKIDSSSKAEPAGDDAAAAQQSTIAQPSETPKQSVDNGPLADIDFSEQEKGSLEGQVEKVTNLGDLTTKKKYLDNRVMNLQLISDTDELADKKVKLHGLLGKRRKALQNEQKKGGKQKSQSPSAAAATTPAPAPSSEAPKQTSRAAEKSPEPLESRAPEVKGKEVEDLTKAMETLLPSGLPSNDVVNQEDDRQTHWLGAGIEERYKEMITPHTHLRDTMFYI